ncbi:MAG: PQQ-binding-like beta-propeller repeat protein [Verrucomicrobia bacterium]|nr:PQQ-binding-like beta-propeller repeat protein [Verrucomicrobiota bacterium]
MKTLALVLIFATVEATADDSPQARDILNTASVKGGLIVHIGCGDGKLTAALRANDSFVVHGLDIDAKNVAAARKYIQSLGLYGKVSVEQWKSERLPYVDNFANLVVVSGDSRVTNDEILRVLAPNGVALVGGRKTVKPWPKAIDEWTHYLHGPDNNAVANDTVVGPPKHYQWIGSPNYLRHHDHLSGLSAMVSAKGRVFYIMDLGPRWSVQMPPQWTLIARDAFNGTILWQRPIKKWHPHLWPLKRGPAQLMRRLVADGDTVYVTLGVGEPVAALDGATGKTLRSYAGTEGAEEIIFADGMLYVVANPELDAYKTISRESVEAIRGAGREWNWDEKPRHIMAIASATGKTQWSLASPVAASTLGTAGGRVCFHDGDKVVCLDARDGKQAWTSKPVPRWKPMHVLFSPTLIVREDVVLFAGGEKLDPQRGGKDTMTALSAKTGEVLWAGEHPPSGYASAEDLFVINNLVWSGDTSSPRDSGKFTGRDLRTGEVKVEFPPDAWRHMPHHRCYRTKATSNFMLMSRTGIEFVDMKSGHWTPSFWVRGSCNYGIMPCNGLVYAGPHSCACFLLAKLNGFNALAPARRSVERGASPRLEPGPGVIADGQSPMTEAEWPTFRHDMSRSGVTKAAVPSELKLSWQTEICGKLSAMTCAEGRLFVASVNTHTVHALDAGSGKRLWGFTVGGRVDSPPTLWQGRVLFGSADGHVYCLRSGDGALVWKFRAAPLDQRLMAQEQVESVWPVSGSVLVREGVVYCVAGRAMWLDGGLRLLRLDAATGRLLSESTLDDKYPGTQDNLQKDTKWPNLPVALPDILSCDDKFIYMRSQPFDFEGRRPEVITPRDYKLQRGETAHLFSATGFLDDSWWHRTYWMWGRSFISAAGGWQLATYQAPAGKILVCDESSVYGYGPAPLKFLGTPCVNHLFACAKEPPLINPNPKQGPRKQGKTIYGDVVVTRLGYAWSHGAPLQARGLVLAGETLFAAGPPAMVDEQQEVNLNYGDPKVQAKMAEHVAAFEGKRGALLMAVSKKEGKQLAAYRLDSPPVFDGMIAANGSLFVATMDGKILCLGSEGKPLLAAPDAKFTTAAATEEAGSTSHPDFQHMANVRVSKSDLGYRMVSGRGETALALKKLPAPFTKRATFRVKVCASPGGAPDKPGNGFIAFGNGPQDAALIKCGFRISGKCLSIVQGPLSGARAASKKAGLKSNEVMEMEVGVDLATQKFKLTIQGETLEAPLAQKLDAITWAGVCLTSVTTDFGALEIAGE